MDDALHILIVDDDDGDRKQVRRALTQSSLKINCSDAASIHDAVRACESNLFDCAIVDYRLTGEDGLSGLKTLGARFPHMALIMITGHGDEYVATEAMKRGASDYISKSKIESGLIRRVLENALEKSALRRKVEQQQEELENFARILVHDLQSPIATILGMASRIGPALQEENAEEAVQYADWVLQTARRMNELIHTLRQYTRANTKVEFEIIDMKRVLEDTRDNLRELFRERRSRVTSDPLPTVFGNAPQLIQLFQNLIVNGIKYCEEPIALIHLSAVPKDDGAWVFSVQDNGIGIPERHYKLVFAPFKRMNGADKCDGTGLGLATCRKIVERHGGTISCESKVGQGTTFRFTLQGAQV